MVRFGDVFTAYFDTSSLTVARLRFLVAYTLSVGYCHSVDTSLLTFVATHVTIQLLFFLSAVDNGAATVRLMENKNKF
jgi:hypothetical protein